MSNFCSGDVGLLMGALRRLHTRSATDALVFSRFVEFVYECPVRAASFRSVLSGDTFVPLAATLFIVLMEDTESHLDGPSQVESFYDRLYSAFPDRSAIVQTLLEKQAQFHHDVARNVAQTVLGLFNL